MRRRSVAKLRLGGARGSGLRTLQVQVKATDKASHFTPPQQLELAYTSGPTHAVARQWSCDAHTVRRLRMLVAQAYLCCQSRVMQIAPVCIRSRGALSWASCLTKWDETSERLCLNLVTYASLTRLP